MEFKRFALAMVGHFLASLLYVLRRLRLLNAVVDTTSYIEHREELKELWEKRMMADDSQSPPPSTADANNDAKTGTEEGSEKAVAKTSCDSETIKTEPDKLANGVAKPVEDGKIIPESESTIPAGGHAKEESALAAVAPPVDADNNNSPDSLEVEEFAEQTYTSETSLVMKPVEVVVKDRGEEEKVPEGPKERETPSEDAILIELEPKVEQMPDVVVAPSEKSIEMSAVKSEVEKIVSEAAELAEKEQVPLPESASSAPEEKVHAPDTPETIEFHEKIDPAREETHPEAPNSSEELFESLEVHRLADEDDDGFVRVEECLPRAADPEPESFVVVEGERVDDASDQLAEKLTAESQKVPMTNGHDVPSPVVVPEPDSKSSHPEMEQFVRSGGLRRVLPGVQKTEQPYSSCTTETKIAMEIREMREREEELRQMREHALVSPVPPKSPVARTPSPCIPKDSGTPSPTPSSYRASSVFGQVGKSSPSPQPPLEEDRSAHKMFKAKESTVEREIRIARDREEELRKQKGLPPREDDSYVKPSQVKSSQVRVFGKAAGGGSVRQAATAKIQMEIEEQTRREMALRDSGSIQTISQERTDSRVAKLKSEAPPVTNGNGCVPTNGGYTNGRSSPDGAVTCKRGSPSPTGPRPASIFSQTTNGKNGISMHKFIASKGKEATFSAPRTNGAPAREERAPAAVPPNMVKLKRNVSVESKIQQEILEMKQREDELKLIHMTQNNGSSADEDEMNQNNLMEYENGNGIHDEDLNPRHNSLIAQWEQRIQKAES